MTPQPDDAATRAREAIQAAAGHALERLAEAEEYLACIAWELHPTQPAAHQITWLDDGNRTEITRTGITLTPRTLACSWWPPA